MPYTPPAGNATNLDIGGAYSPPSGNNVNLNFSDENYKDRSLTIGFLLPKAVISASINAAKVSNVTAALVLKPPVISALVNAEAPPAADYTITAALVLAKPHIAAAVGYTVNNARVTSTDVAGLWQAGTDHTGALAGEWAEPVQFRDKITGEWNTATCLTDAVKGHFQPAEHQRQNMLSNWQAGSSVAASASDGFKPLLHARHSQQLPWQHGWTATGTGRDGFKNLYRLRPIFSSGFERGQQLCVRWSFRFSLADWINTVGYLVWQQARKPPIGRNIANPLDPPIPPEYRGSTLLNLVCELCCIDPLDIRLNFGIDACPQNHKVIFIMNEISLKRVSDGADIEILSAQVGIDKNSWCWSFSGAIPKTELAKVRPGSSGPVEVELEINGFRWRFIVESYNESKQFANTSVSVQGRSVTALLDAPYAPVRSYTEISSSYARTLADNELARNGEASGFSLDWQLIDALGWLVPGNVFNYSNLTPVAAIKAIAESVGGYVNSDPVTRTLHIRPEYAFPVWQLASRTPDKTISYDFVTRESLKWNAAPGYDKVFVSGENNGVVAAVVRSGTAGTNEAPQVVHQLITDGTAARQRGIVELSRGGKQADISIELPLVTDIGLCLPSQIIDFDVPCDGDCIPQGLEAWRGIVNGVSISVASSDGKLTVTQTVDLERRYED